MPYIYQVSVEDKQMILVPMNITDGDDNIVLEFDIKDEFLAGKEMKLFIKSKSQDTTLDIVDGKVALPKFPPGWVYIELIFLDGDKRSIALYGKFDVSGALSSSPTNVWPTPLPPDTDFHRLISEVVTPMVDEKADVVHYHITDDITDLTLYETITSEDILRLF